QGVGGQGRWPPAGAAGRGAGTPLLPASPPQLGQRAGPTARTRCPAMLEDDLRTLFTLEAETDQPPSHISVPAAGRGARVRQRLQRARTIGSPVLAAAAVTAVIVTSVALVGGGQRSARTTGPAVAVPGSADWTRLPRAPIAPRSEYAAIWTGKKMIVWGGYSGITTTALYGDGAAY